MSNVTLSVDDAVIKGVRKIVIDKNTTLTAMVREYLESVVRRGETQKRRALRELRDAD